jgi:hypothetical protein
LVTCSALPAGDVDDAVLPAALAGVGLSATWATWDDASVDWTAYAAAVLRSTWDYPLRRDEFLAWARGLPVPLLNPADVVAWNTDKSYLRDLADDGLPVVPTAFAAPGEPLALPGTAELVVKPSVSAGSRDTARFAADEHDRARALVDRIHASGRVAMAQPYLDAVDERGETALLFFGGSFSHAIRKGPLLAPHGAPTDGLYAEEDIRPRRPAPAELAVGRDAVAAVERRLGRVPYARVDLLADDAGDPILLEVELVEPSLFFAHAAGAVDRFAAAVRDTLDAVTS